MKLFRTEGAAEDYLHWRRNDPDTLRKINALIEDIQHTSFRGLGKPESLTFALAWPVVAPYHVVSIGWFIAYRDDPANRSWKLPSAPFSIRLRVFRIT